MQPVRILYEKRGEITFEQHNHHFQTTPIRMSPRALVTGGTGLLGRAVVKAFKGAGWEVTGTGFSRASPPETLKLDILDGSEVAKVLDEVK